jgi:hypothetical protein
MFHLEDWSSHSNWLQVTLTHLPLGKIFYVFNIYMSSQSQDKSLCWRSLLNLQENQSNSSLIFTRDFNTTLNASEKHGGNIVRDSSREFMEELMQGLDVLDVKPVSGRYTWSNKRQGSGAYSLQAR